MAINIGKNTDGDVTYKNPPVDRVLFPNIKEGASMEEIQEAVDAWLDDHPEATTTVQDGSILPVKLNSSNSASDGYVLSYNATAGKFEWYDIGGELDDINSDITDLKQDLEGLDVYTLGLYPQMEVEDTAVASFTDGADDIPVKALTVDITPVQSGSGDPSPSNVRPISGWTGANVSVKGFNQFDGEWVEDTGYNVAENYMPVIPGETYYIYAPNIPSGERIYANTYDSNKTLVGSSVSIGRVGAYVIPDNVYYMKLRCWGEFDYTNLCFNISDPAKNGTYEPYKGNVYSITFPTSAGTVYGGTLDVTSGVLTVDRALITPNTPSSMLNTDNPDYKRAIFSAPGIKNLADSTVVNTQVLCNRFKTITGQSTYRRYDEGISDGNNDNYVYIYVENLQTISAWEEWIDDNPLQIIYPLVTPVTYQLDPVAIATILGENNIFADTGNINELTYRADLKAYIDSHVGS